LPGRIGSPGSSIVARYTPSLFKDGYDFDAVEAAAEPPYALSNIHVDYVRVEPLVFGRLSGAASDQPATSLWSKASWTTWRTRRSRILSLIIKGLLGHNPRALAVLSLAAEKAGWGSPLPARHGRGISVQFAYGSYLSQVAEVEVAADGSRGHTDDCHGLSKA
jgi:isoquinoline 1-oxidoreductase subunit beta